MLLQTSEFVRFDSDQNDNCTLGRDAVGASQLSGTLRVEGGCLEQLVSCPGDLTTPLEDVKLLIFRLLSCLGFLYCT